LNEVPLVAPISPLVKKWKYINEQQFAWAQAIYKGKGAYLTSSSEEILDGNGVQTKCSRAITL